MVFCTSWSSVIWSGLGWTKSSRTCQLSNLICFSSFTDSTFEFEKCTCKQRKINLGDLCYLLCSLYTLIHNGCYIWSMTKICAPVLKVTSFVLAASCQTLLFYLWLSSDTMSLLLPVLKNLQCSQFVTYKNYDIPVTLLKLDKFNLLINIQLLHLFKVYRWSFVDTPRPFIQTQNIVCWSHPTFFMKLFYYGKILLSLNFLLEHKWQTWFPNMEEVSVRGKL